MIVTNLQDKIRGSLLGGAIGDALGYPVEFLTLDEIKRQYGSQGITDFQLSTNGKALISDDTQMTLFTANGLLFGITRWATHGMLSKLDNYVLTAYKEWYQTQTQVFDDSDYHTCWIRDIRELNARRAPGSTCMSALSQHGEVVNNSKGCGGIMRVAPVALCLCAENKRMAKLDDGQEPFRLISIDYYGGRCAQLTHKHPLGYLPAALMVDLLYHIVYCEREITPNDLQQWVDDAFPVLAEIYQMPEEVAALSNLRTLTNNVFRLIHESVNQEEAILQLGEGWVAEEAWAIALYCTLKHFGSFEKAIAAAVNHDGDSDSTGAICGNLIGAIVGYEAIPDKYKHDIELKDVILSLADDMVHGCTIDEYHLPQTPDEIKWEQRYVWANPGE